MTNAADGSSSFVRKVGTYLGGFRTPESDNFNSHRSERLKRFTRTGLLNFFNEAL
jgi:hypothetical protein